MYDVVALGELLIDFTGRGKLINTIWVKEKGGLGKCKNNSRW
jgi:hypothetical protein